MNTDARDCKEGYFVTKDMWQRIRAAVIAGALVCVPVMTGGTHAEPIVTVVMSGLDNPRGLAFGPEGALYVAEAGRGGDGPCFFNSAGEFRCYGSTGAMHTPLARRTGARRHQPPVARAAGRRLRWRRE